MDKKPLVIFVVGPTASGKSKLACELARRHKFQIVNADSIQVYQGLNVGSAKPSLEERKEIPHHLYDIVEQGGLYNAGDYFRDSRNLINSNLQQRFLVVGGSGFYIQALQKGVYASPEVAEQIKERVQSLISLEGLQTAHKKLNELDPEYAKSIPPTDSYRVARGLELLSTGTKPSQIRKDFTPEPAPFRIITIGTRLARPRLEENIRVRAKTMLSQGLVDEVQSLIKEGLRNWAPLASVGYRETVSFIEGHIKYEDLVEKITLSTRQLAKKQMTWFKRDTQTQWFDMDAEYEKSVQYVDEVILTEA